MKVAVVMGSQSDLPIMQEAIDFLKEKQIPILVDIVSAHRTPEKLISFGKNAHLQGIDVIIAGAGGCCTPSGYACCCKSTASHWGTYQES